MLRKQRKRRKLLIMAGILMSLAAGAKPGSMTAFAAETAVTAQQTQTAQSDRWEGTGNTWKLRKADNSGYVTNSWFQDLDGSWYMLGSTGEMYAGLITDQSTGKSYLLNTEHDGTYGRMLTKDGVYTVNGSQIYLTFNQSHDGTYGAILTGLSEIRTSGVQETELPSIPTDSDTGSSKSGGGQSSNTASTGSGTGWEKYRKSDGSYDYKSMTRQELETISLGKGPSDVSRARASMELSSRRRVVVDEEGAQDVQSVINTN
jgi:hypothetical protein